MTPITPSDIRDDDIINLSEIDDVDIVESKPKLSFDLLLPKPKDMKLTEEQVQDLAALQAAFVILGPAAGAVLICPGNQENLSDDKKCPYFAKCTLLKAKKAPEGYLCPIERVITEQRFTSWCQRIGQDPTSLTEDARITVSELVWMDIQEQRCVNILSTGEAARLTQVNVTEAINYTTDNGQGLQQQVLPLTWERVLHVNTARLDTLQEKRRLLLRDWMLTPEQEWKKQRAEGKAKGADLGSIQAARGDALREMDPVFE